ncbi:MAG: hypothetical protein RRY95_02425 [Oscillospiraceae bacterium]
MANRGHSQCRRTNPPIPMLPPLPRFPCAEPTMHRYPHPLPDTASAPTALPDPMLHYIRCALSYQTELLGEIKTLLEELSATCDHTNC